MRKSHFFSIRKRRQRLPLLILLVLINSFCSSNEKVQDIVDDTEKGMVDNDEDLPTKYIPGLTDDFEGDISIYPKTAEDNGHAPDMGVDKTIDGDLKTRFNTPFGNAELPAVLEYFFDTDSVSVIDYIILYPRTDGDPTGRFGKTVIYTKSLDDDKYVKLDEFDFKESENPQKIDFPDGFKNPKAVKIEVKSGAKNPIGNQGASLAEIEFYKTNTAIEDIYLEIFEDKAATQLRPDVTLEDIDKIGNDFIKRMAKAIYNDVYEDWRVNTYVSYPDSRLIAEENKTGTYGYYDNVTGVFVKWGTDMVIFADDFEGDISLKIVDHKSGFDGVNYILKPGVNHFKVETEGLAYLIYQNESDYEVKINISTGKFNGYFDITEHTNSDWQEILNNASYDYLDVLGEKAMLSFTTDDFRQNTGDIEELVGYYDRMVELQDEFIGLYKYDRVPHTRAYYRTNSHDKNMYMYMTSFRTEYNKNVMYKLTDINEIKNNPWGVAHELGHIHQTRPGFNWTGLGEVSNNLYTLIVQTAFGNKTNLESQGGDDLYKNSYEKGFSQSLTKMSHAEIEDGMVKLIPFWQLQLYFDKIADHPDFYKDLHEYLRTHDDPDSPGALQVNFAKAASKVAQLDLTDFFTAWGFITPTSTEVEDYTNATVVVTEAMAEDVISYAAQFPKPEEDLKYLTDQNVNVYQTAGKLSAGSATVTGNAVNISGSSNVVVYEQERNGEVIFVSMSNEFTTEDFNRDTDKLYVVDYRGEKQEIPVN